MIHNPDLPLHAYFSAAGSRWSIRSNCAAVLESAAGSFPALNHFGCADLAIDLYVDSTATTRQRWEVPQFRGRDHLVFADYGPGDCLLADLRARKVIGRFSPATAQDMGYWKQVIFPVLLGIVGAVVGVTALHCACLRYQGEGLLITGESGAGKSTLSFELARRGLEFVSDDWTYFCRAGREVLAWGLPANIKLLPDSVRHFPELRDHTPAMHLNGELALEVDPETAGARRALCCRPGRIFLIERPPGAGFEVARLAKNEIFTYFQQSLERLPAILAKSREQQLATIRALCGLECWRLRCGGTPQEIATRMLQFCEHLSPAPASMPPPLLPARRQWPDMLRRFVALPFVQQFSFDGFHFQVASDSERVLRALGQITETSAAGAPSVLWTIQLEPDWPLSLSPSSEFGCGALSFLTLGRHSFIACDRLAGRAHTSLAPGETRAQLQAALRSMLLHLARGRVKPALPVLPQFTPAADSGVPTC